MTTAERWSPTYADPHRIALRADGRVIMLRLADVDWVDAENDRVRFHVGGTVHAQRDTLSRLEQRLPASRFLRIHRSTIVNVERIRELQPWFQGTWVVILADGTRLRTGARYQDNVRAYLERVT
jgi:two-component system LytT family response regulator